MTRRLKGTLVGLAIAAGSVAGTTAGAAPHRTEAGSAQTLVDRFRAERLDGNAWRHWWGKAELRNGMLGLSSAPSWVPAETHSALVVTRRAWQDFRGGVDVRPVSQLRRDDSPNAWETGWILFRMQSLWDYYYFIVKPNGWELGKKQGSDAQIFLATGDQPRLAIGERARVSITAVGARIRVAVNGRQILDYTDPSPLLGAGGFGLYEEDAAVRFGHVRIAAA